jgi:hypothetical protein
MVAETREMCVQLLEGFSLGLNIKVERLPVDGSEEALVVVR